MSSATSSSAGRFSALFGETVDTIAASRFKRETERMYAARAVVEEAASHRRAAAQELRDLGWTYQRIADLIGGNAQNIHRLLTRTKKEDHAH